MITVIVRRVGDALLSALVAPPCAICGAVLERPLDGAVCARCWDAVAGGPITVHASSILARAAAVGEYDGVLRDVIHALKYHGRRSTAPRLARLMAQHGGDVLAGADAVVPVPLHRQRERERGFNQADMLARGLGVPVTPLLRRTRATTAQVDLPASARHHNVRGAFALRRTPWWRRERSSAVIGGRTFVLVDDVTTTGATLEACARVLLGAGAKEVRALTAARVSIAGHRRPRR